MEKEEPTGIRQFSSRSETYSNPLEHRQQERPERRTMNDWRCAVLRGWTPEYGQALTPIAAVAWEEGSTVSSVRVRWVPSMTKEEALAADIWRHRLALADPDLPITEFLDHYAMSEATGIVLSAVPPRAVSLGGAADLLLDEILYTSAVI